jgi:methionine-rich copper-binding protein CopC
VRIFKPLFFLIVYTIGINLFFLPVYGHANPTVYNPKPNQTFDTSNGQAVPDKITITFSERPEIKASNIKVTDSKNTRVDNNDLKTLSNDERTLSVSLGKSKIIPGTYTVNWIVLSKDDGHITKGSYVFSVAENNKQNDNQQQTTNSLPKYSKNLTAENIVIKFGISPFQAGQNTFSLAALYNNGTSVKNINNVYLEFNNPTKNVGPIVDVMNKTSTANYSSTGSFLSQTGDWEIKIVVQRTGEYDINQKLDVNIK